MKNYFVHPLPVLPSPRKKNTLKNPFKGPVPRVRVIIMPGSGHNMGQDLDYFELSWVFMASLNSKASIAFLSKVIIAISSDDNILYLMPRIVRL